MNETNTAFKPKKSVALSGVVAGNTALCTVGRTGNDLSYRGYDILEIAQTCEFEEIAHLLIHEKLPNRAELAAYRRKLCGLRGLPPGLKTVLESLPASSHPMDVLRTASRRSVASSRKPRRTPSRAPATSRTGSSPVSAPCSVTGTISAARGGGSSRSLTTIHRRPFPASVARAANPRRNGCGPCTPR